MYLNNKTGKSTYIGILFVALFLGFSCSLNAQKRFTISGTISGIDGETLPGATIIDARNINKGTYSNLNGNYSISMVPGEARLVFSYVGYGQKEIVLMLRRDTTVNVSLIQDNNIEAVTIYAPGEKNNAMSSRMGVIDVPVEQIKTTPALLGETDVLKVIQLMPGIQSGGDGNVGLFIRGGNYDQNMITLDGAILYNPEHMKGFVSAFNADIIDYITVYKGSFPARYGSRLSGVVDIGIRDGDFESFHGSATAGLLSAKLYLEGPVIENKTSFIVSGRRSYYNLITNAYLNNIYDKTDALTQFARIYYYDINAKISHRISDNDNLQINFYLGDDINDSEGKKTGSKDTVNNVISSLYSKYDTENAWGNIITGVKWRHSFGEKLSSGTMLNYSRYGYDYYLKSSQEFSEIHIDDTEPDSSSVTVSSIRYLSEIEDITACYDIEYSPSGRHSITAGAG